MFFKSNKEIKTKDLKLSDYNQIWTKFCFLDESGSLSNRLEPYFTVGLLKMSMPYYLQSKILYERSKRNFYDEVKFNKISKNRLAISGVCRFDSKSNDLLQIVDLIIGAVTYDIKYQNKLVSGDKFKLELVEYIKNKLGTNTFIKGFKNYNFNIFVEQDNGIE